MKVSVMAERIRSGLRRIVCALGDLADESLYRRHLAARGRAPSRDEWRSFTERRYASRYRNARCC